MFLTNGLSMPLPLVDLLLLAPPSFPFIPVAVVVVVVVVVVAVAAAAATVSVCAAAAVSLAGQQKATTAL